jgi:Methyl-accepting chemotaxis protein
MKSFVTKYTAGYIITGLMIAATGLVTGSALAGAVATFVGFVTLGSITGTVTLTTVTDLRHQTLALVEGDLDRELSSNRRDEFGDLYRAIDELRESLRSQIKEAEENRARAQEAQREAEALAERREEERQALSQQVDQMVEAMQRFAGGDLTVQAQTGSPEANAGEKAVQLEEIGRLKTAFNRSVENIRQVFRQVSEAVDQADAVANRLAGSSDQLNAGVQRQAEQANEGGGGHRGDGPHDRRQRAKRDQNCQGGPEKWRPRP